MVFILRAIILWLSIFGYTSAIKKYTNAAFAPIIVLTSIGTVMFLAGLLNIMVITVLLIVLGGIICLILKKPWRKAFYKDNCDSLIVFGVFTGICVLLLLRLYNKVPVHYDCFSHWLTVIKEMINSNSMPNFSSDLIMFQGYPTGSAGFVYFFCKFLGNSRDDLIVFIQSILYVAAICPFLAFIKNKKDIFSILIFISGSLFCIVANSSQNAVIDDLLVDTLISLLSISVVAIVIYFKDKLLHGVLASLPIQIFLIAVKNSGILMVAINTALIVILTFISDYKATKKLSLINTVKHGFLTAGIPAAVYYLWLQHVEYVFASGTTSKHTASIDNYMQTFSSKNTEQIKEILSVFLKRFLSWNNSWLLLIIVCSIIIIGMLIKRYVIKEKSLAEYFIVLGIIATYLAFMLVLAAMYIFSMPYAESIVLASYSRYENTILVFIVGIVTIYLLSLMPLLPHSSKGVFIKIALTALMCLCLFNQSQNIQKTFIKKDTYTGSSRYEFEQIKNEYGVPEGKTYFIYGSRFKNDAGYHKYLTKYIFWSNNIKLTTSDNFDENKEVIENYDYLIIIDYDEKIGEYLSENNINSKENVYEIKEAFK